MYLQDVTSHDAIFQYIKMIPGNRKPRGGTWQITLGEWLMMSLERGESGKRKKLGLWRKESVTGECYDLFMLGNSLE